MPKFHKLQRGSCLSLFISSSIASYFNPHMLYIAGLSILGVICYDVVCYLKEKSVPKDYTQEIEEMKVQHAETYQMIKDMKDDVSIGKLASSFRRDR